MDIVVTAEGDNLFFRGPPEKGVSELTVVYSSGLQKRFYLFRPEIAHPDRSYQPVASGLLKCFDMGAQVSSGFRPMEVENIDVGSSHSLQALFNSPTDCIGGTEIRFGRDGHITACFPKLLTDHLFGNPVAISLGGIEMANAPGNRAAKDFDIRPMEIRGASSLSGPPLVPVGITEGPTPETEFALGGE